MRNSRATVNTWAGSPAATMNDHLTELAQRRARLQEKAAAQRRQLSAHMSVIDARFGGVDRGLARVRNWLRTPLLLAGGAALPLGVGPSRALRFVGKATLLISTARRLLRLAR